MIITKLFNKFFITILLITIFLYSSCVSSQLAKEEGFPIFLDSLSSQFTEYASNTDKLSISVMTFQSTRSGVKDEEFSVYLAESIASEVTKGSPNISLFERGRLELIFEENELNLSGIIDPSKAKEIGKIAPIDAILSGTYTELRDSIDVNCRLIDVSTGKVLFTFSDRFTKSDNILFLLNSNNNIEEEVNIQENNLTDSKNQSFIEDGRIINGTNNLPKPENLNISNEIVYLQNLNSEKKIELDTIPWNKIPLAFRDPEGNALDKKTSSDVTGIQLAYDDQYLYYAFHTVGEPEAGSMTGYQINLSKNETTRDALYDFNLIMDGDIAVSHTRRMINGLGQENDLFRGSAKKYKNGIVGIVPLSILELRNGDTIFLQPHVNNGSIGKEVQQLNSKQFELSTSLKISFFTHPGWEEIPYKSISVDGELDDWNSIKPIYSGQENGRDKKTTIKNVYISKDNTFIYLCMDLFSDKPVADETRYLFNLYNYSKREVGDLEISYRFWDGHWRTQLNQYLGDNNWEGISTPRSYGRSGSVIEMKLPIKLINNPSSFSLYGYTTNVDNGMIDNTGDMSFVY